MVLTILAIGAAAMLASSWVALRIEAGRDLDDISDDLTDEELEELG